MLFETVQIVSRALMSVRRRESERYGDAVGASLQKKTKCVEGGGWCLVRAKLCVPLEPLAEAVQRAKAALSLQELRGGELAGRCGGEKLASFEGCAEERMCLD